MMRRAAVAVLVALVVGAVGVVTAAPATADPWSDGVAPGRWYGINDAALASCIDSPASLCSPGTGIVSGGHSNGNGFGRMVETPPAGTAAGEFKAAFYRGSQPNVTVYCRAASGGLSGVQPSPRSPSTLAYPPVAVDTFTFDCGSGGLYAINASGQNNARWVVDGPKPPPPPPNVQAGSCRVSDAQLAMLARGAGFTGDQVVTAVAVALAESEGLVNAVNFNADPPSYDVGLWQINDKAHPGYDRDRLGTDPSYNAAAAHAIWTDAAGWSPWVAYAKNRHSRFVERAQRAATSTGGQTLTMSNCDGGEWVGVGGDPNGFERDCSSLNPVKIAHCLFVPAPASLDKVTGLGDQLTGAFPFNYVSATWATLDTALTVCQLDYDVPDGGAGHTCDGALRLQVLGESVTLLGGEDVFVDRVQIVRPFLAAAIWLSFLIPLSLWLWRRLFPVVNE